MIRKPPITLGGKFGWHLKKVWEALESLAPQSGPGVLTNHTTRGVTRQAGAGRGGAGKMEEAIVTAVHDDVLECGARLVAKPWQLRCSLWAGARSWMPGMPFRFRDAFAHPLLNAGEQFDFQYVVADGAFLRTRVYDRPQTVPNIGTMQYTKEPQAIWPPYVREEASPPAIVGEAILIAKLPGALTLSEDIIDPFTGVTTFAAGTAVNWIDLNVDARRWLSLPAAIYFERTFDKPDSPRGDGLVIHWNQAV